jgi:predicted nucleic acid-binding protein
MILLDTNVASELMKAKMDANVLSWLRRAGRGDHYLTSTSVMEMWYGAERFHLRTGSSRLIDATEDLVNKRFAGKILALDAVSAALSGRVRASREAAGHAITVQDAQIAAICLQHGATLATRNTKDFEGLDLKLVNPFEGA